MVNHNENEDENEKQITELGPWNYNTNRNSMEENSFKVC